MRYVDAGYAICMGTLFFYAVWLIFRRRRLERAVAVARRDVPAAAPGGGTAGFAGDPAPPADHGVEINSGRDPAVTVRSLP